VVLLISVFVVIGSYGFEYMDNDWKLMMMDSTLRYYWILFDGLCFYKAFVVLLSKEFFKMIMIMM
jgi:hypothetical protein